MTFTGKCKSRETGKILCVGDLSGGLERSDLRFFFSAPNSEFVNLGLTPPGLADLKVISLSEALRRFHANEYDVVVYGKIPCFSWSPRKNSVRNAVGFLKSGYASNSFMDCWRARRLMKVFSAKLAVMDLEDRPIIDNSRFDQAFHAKLYFKRELPQNPANAFLYTTAKNEDNGNICRQKFFKTVISKLRPISIGIADSFLQAGKEISMEKNNDVFFCGQVNARPNRLRGIQCLSKLREDGFRVDIPEAGLSKADFLERCARSLTVWSPEGFGYECYRTYESAAMGSVPILQYPTIQRHAPLLDGKHALYYGVEDFHLYEILRRSLSDRQSLIGLGQNARLHVGMHHTHSALAAAVRNAFRQA